MSSVEAIKAGIESAKESSGESRSALSGVTEASTSIAARLYAVADKLGAISAELQGISSDVEGTVLPPLSSATEKGNEAYTILAGVAVGSSSELATRALGYYNQALHDIEGGTNTAAQLRDEVAELVPRVNRLEMAANGLVQTHVQGDESYGVIGQADAATGNLIAGDEAADQWGATL